MAFNSATVLEFEISSMIYSLPLHFTTSFVNSLMAAIFLVKGEAKELQQQHKQMYQRWEQCLKVVRLELLNYAIQKGPRNGAMLKHHVGKKTPRKKRSRRAELIPGSEVDKDEDFKPLPKQRRGDVRRKRREKQEFEGNSSYGNGLRQEGKDAEQAGHDKVENGIEFCPICQFPFRNLIGQSKEWHVNDCLASRGSTVNLG